MTNRDRRGSDDGCGWCNLFTGLFGHLGDVVESGVVVVEQPEASRSQSSLTPWDGEPCWRLNVRCYVTVT